MKLIVLAIAMVLALLRPAHAVDISLCDMVAKGRSAIVPLAAELDDGRKQYLLTRMREKQTFVTSCDDTAFLKTDGEVYRMNGGVLTKV